MLILKSGAILIADVHYDSARLDFLDFLDYVEAVNPPQLILLGDIFNLLIGGIKSSQKEHASLIARLDSLAQNIEIIYFEGNHDFNLEKLFKKVKIIKRQPVLAHFEGCVYALSHGDIFLPRLTQIALRFLRLSGVIFLLNCLNILSFDKLYQKICNQQKVKILYKKLEFFENLAQIRINSYKEFFAKKSQKIEYIVEGHFHQGKEFQSGNIKYKNLEAFANDRSFFILECGGLKKYNYPERSKNG